MQLAHGQLAVGSTGQAQYTYPIAVPPGVAGMSPQLAMEYSDGGSQGVSGVGWSLQGVSYITRCAPSRTTDRAIRAVTFGPDDKFCLNGLRLIRTDADGTSLLRTAQVNDALGPGAGAPLEFRTEIDSFSRIRAYGAAGSVASNGPAYFKVWTKAGQVLEFGTSPGPNTNAQVTAGTGPIVTVWALSRISDVAGNVIDFKYDQRMVSWGSALVAGSPIAGREWSLAEIYYAGNKVVFSYSDRPATAYGLDAFEAYHAGYKTVQLQRLDSIKVYVNSPNPDVRGRASTAVPVRNYQLAYDNGPTTKRSRLTSIKECSGEATTSCLPPTAFTYSQGRSDMRSPSGAFSNPDASGRNLASRKLFSFDGKYGTMAADFNGDGKADLLRWSETGSENELWISNGDGSFTFKTNGTTPGTFNIADQLFRSDGCYLSIAQDMNGDGIPDIVRIPATTSKTGAACNVPMTATIYQNDGTGYFTQRMISNSSGAAIAVDRKTSRKVFGKYCGSIAQVSTGTVTDAQPTTPELLLVCRTGKGYSAGATFYLTDVNGDGRTDLIVSSVPELLPEDPGSGTAPDPVWVSCASCTSVYIANENGTFDLQASNLSNYIVYSDPMQGLGATFLAKVRDADKDGLGDLVAVGTVYKTHSYRSLGTGNFEQIANPAECTTPIDFNGDGKADCLLATNSAPANKLHLWSGSGSYQTIANFNLVSAGQELDSSFANVVGSNYGVVVLDLNGDRREDILRWHDDPAQSKVYLSNGDGTYTESPAALSQTGGINLRHSNGLFDIIIGDFTGNGVQEILRVSDGAPSAPANGSAQNKLLVASSAFTGVDDPDQLRTVVSPSGLTTTVSRARLSNAGSRYVSDVATPAKAVFPKADFTPPIEVVVSTETQTGIGSGTVKTEYAYAGFKIDTTGRGVLGFREVQRQGVNANGLPSTSVTTYVQEFPYVGEVASAKTFNAGLGATGLAPLTDVYFSYCDKGTGATMFDVLTPDVSRICVSVPFSDRPFVYKPYLFKKVERGWDLGQSQGAVPLSTTVTRFDYDGLGNVLTMSVSVSGTDFGAPRSYTKNTTNQYFPAVTSGDSWIHGRLQSATVTSTAPGGAIPSTSAGSAPTASSRGGAGPVQ